MEKEWRAHDERNHVVTEFYRAMRTHQTFGYVIRMERKYCSEFRRRMSVFEAMDSLTALIDKSDPDITLPNIQHLFQTAEVSFSFSFTFSQFFQQAMRSACCPEWM